MRTPSGLDHLKECAKLQWQRLPSEEMHVSFPLYLKLQFRNRSRRLGTRMRRWVRRASSKTQPTQGPIKTEIRWPLS